MKESEDARWAGIKSEEVGRIALPPPPGFDAAQVLAGHSLAWLALFRVDTSACWLADCYVSILVHIFRLSDILICLLINFTLLFQQ